MAAEAQGCFLGNLYILNIRHQGTFGIKSPSCNQKFLKTPIFRAKMTGLYRLKTIFSYKFVVYSFEGSNKISLLTCNKNIFPLGIIQWEKF
jgi:hypothetical protein